MRSVVALDNLPEELEQHVKRRTCQALRRKTSNEHYGGWAERGVLVGALLRHTLAKVADSSARAGIGLLKSMLEDWPDL